jgi:hypothetical protein
MRLRSSTTLGAAAANPDQPGILSHPGRDDAPPQRAPERGSRTGARSASTRHEGPPVAWLSAEWRATPGSHDPGSPFVQLSASGLAGVRRSGSAATPCVCGSPPACEGGRARAGVRLLAQLSLSRPRPRRNMLLSHDRRQRHNPRPAPSEHLELFRRAPTPHDRRRRTRQMLKPHDRPRSQRQAQPPQLPLLADMEVIVRRQDREHCASITCMIRHYVARRAQVTEGHPHNAEERVLDGRMFMRPFA